MQKFKQTGAHGLFRVIGSVDARGDGLKHDLFDVNPFVLFDQTGVLEEAHVPPFGLHPHHGLQVISFVWKGAVRSLVPGTTPIVAKGPGAMCVNAGRGMAHEEYTGNASEIFEF